MMAKYEIEIDKVPEGWAPIAVGSPKIGEYYLWDGKPLKSTIEGYGSVYVILERIKQYREPVLPSDFGKRAEFSDDGVQWTIGTVGGWCKYDDEDEFTWMCITCGYKHCRIEVTQ